MSVTINPLSLLSGAVTRLVDSSVIVGMPSSSTPIPLFVLCEIPTEKVSSSARLPGAVMQTGELRARTVINASTFECDVVVSDIPMDDKAELYRVIQVILGDAALLVNSLATYGAVLPNLSGIETGFVSSCISVLNQMKNNGMSIMILGNYFSLGAVQQTTPYLLSGWYLESIEPQEHKGGEAGTVIHLKLKEQFTPMPSSILGMIMAIASETLSTNADLTMGSLI